MTLARSKRFLPPLVFVVAMVLTFTATAHAAAAVAPPEADIWDLLRPVYEAFAQGHYLWAGSLCIVVSVALARRYLVPRWNWLASDAGSALLVLLGSFGGTLAATLAGGVEFQWQMLSTAFKIAFMAAGGYTALKALVIRPYLTRFASKGPAWLHRPLELVLWIFERTEPQVLTLPANSMVVVSNSTQVIQGEVKDPPQMTVILPPDMPRTKTDRGHVSPVLVTPGPRLVEAVPVLVAPAEITVPNKVLRKDDV